MSEISSLDTSQYTTPLSLQMLPIEQLSTTAIDTVKSIKRETPNAAALEDDTPKVDLNNYYSNVKSADLNSDTQTYLLKAEENFNNAIADAVTNGMNPNDIVNIIRAKSAYKATINVASESNIDLMI